MDKENIPPTEGLFEEEPTEIDDGYTLPNE